MRDGIGGSGGKLTDAHVHLEKGNYTAEWLQQFIAVALRRNVGEIFFLEHTHIFRECECLYEEMAGFNAYQERWYEGKRRKARPLEEYTDFDFLAGAVHFIDGWAFSHLKQPWKPEDYDLRKLYSRYYELLWKLAASGLFSGMAHPNSLQCFGAYPPGDYREAYQKLAEECRKKRMYVECSSGLAINYGDSQVGMNPQMLRAMLKNGVPVFTASDAHIPENVGKLVGMMAERIEKARWRQEREAEQ
ncbi:MAG TPA: hypothetical protein H9831_12890 [Candidatus Eisenbergiella pullistercoris]|uniref:Histidinol-phosphatase n=1 Tax=Candidatus Eisenbergiella pullistercoris TaxID=2838555 RepID=A0A9D2C829_9FIRM|nr:hypothetical protein [Candidatus Eisenbergiella pullistercoris]